MPGRSVTETQKTSFGPFRSTLSDTSPVNSLLPSRLVSPSCHAYPAGSGKASIRLLFAALQRNLEWTPKLRQANKTHFSSNGELCYGAESTEVHVRI